MGTILTAQNAKIGMRIKHVNVKDNLATIAHIGTDMHGNPSIDVAQDDPTTGQSTKGFHFDIPWNGTVMSLWEIAEESKVKLTKELCKVGLRVHRNVVPLFPGSNATITGVSSAHFSVKWDDGHGSVNWEFDNTTDMKGWYILDAVPVQANGRAEKPCITCKRPNDIGSKSCWCCGNPPHADTVAEAKPWWK